MDIYSLVPQGMQYPLWYLLIGLSALKTYAFWVLAINQVVKFKHQENSYGKLTVLGLCS